MREIKFRAWDKYFKEFSLTVNVEAYKLSLDYPDRYVLMQFTGLKDKNGKEIYEGDIVRYRIYYTNFFRTKPNSNHHDEHIGIVEWRNDSACFWINGKTWTEFDWIKIIASVKVIGNIYENPELLNK